MLLEPTRAGLEGFIPHFEPFIQHIPSGVKLKGGSISYYYVNFKKFFVERPSVARELVRELLKDIWEEASTEIIGVAGSGYSGLILVSLASTINPNVRPILVRDTERLHGIVSPVIAPDLVNKMDIFIIDDVCSTGGTIRDISKKLISAGIEWKGVYVLVDRGLYDPGSLEIKSLFKFNPSLESVQ